LITTRDYFSKALVFDPWKTSTLVSLAQINLALYQSGDVSALPEALVYSEKAIAARPNEPLSHSVYATALYYNGDYNTSADEMKKYTELHPKLLKGYEDLAKHYLNIGMAYKNSGSDRKAKEFYQKVLDVPDLINLEMDSVSPLELDLWRKNNSEPVLYISPLIKTYTGAAYLLSGERNSARTALSAALEEQPGSMDTLMWNSVYQDIVGNKSESRALLEKASMQNPGIIRTYEAVRNLITM